MTTFTDDFDRADSTNLGVNWTEVSGDWSIVSNQLSPGSAGGTIILCATGAMSSNDNFAQVKITATAAVSQGVWCRGNSNITSGYLLRNNGTQWDLFAVVGGSFLNIGTYVAAAVVGDVAKVQAVGSTIKCFVNDIERISVTDTQVTTGTSVGIRSESSAAMRFDNFSAGDVVTTINLGVASTVETAVPISVSKMILLGIAGEIDSPVSPSLSKSISIGQPGEVDSSVSFSLSKEISINSTTENDSAQSLGISKTISLGVAATVETAVPLTVSKSILLSSLEENDTAIAIGVIHPLTLGVAQTVETAVPITITKTINLPPVLETDTAIPIKKEVSDVAQSILTTVKKVLGIAATDTSFDTDVILHINSVFSVLDQIGIGPDGGFSIEDSTPVWEDFVDDKRKNSVKTYVYLRVRLMFDPPTTSFVIESMEKQIKELEWRLNVTREGDAWQDKYLPTPS